MRTLIDGYNLMFALGLMGKRFSPDGFRKARTRFLNDLAAAIGAVAAHQTTVVFDARFSPGHLPHESTHKGLSVLFAVEDEGADARIERLIAAHSTPRTLTVVSSDQRIRQAASRRKARAVTADAFWDEMEAPRPNAPRPPPPTSEETARLQGLSPAESAHWLETFRHVADEPGADEVLDTGGFVPSDDEIARIRREVDDEFERGLYK
jgi:predicted RNA-binding protein with PIN domain